MVRAEKEAFIAAPREALWEFIADTDRLNRELKLPAVQFSFQPREEGGSRLRGAARFVGRLFHYNEEPYCWVRPAKWSVRRIVDDGPLRTLSPGVELREAEGGTHVTAFMEIEPRSPLFIAIARSIADASANSLIRACRIFEEHCKGSIATPYPRHSAIPPAHRARLQTRLHRMRNQGADPILAERLAALLTDAPIEDVTHLRPYLLARRWGLPRRTLLETCLLAVRSGLMDLRWRLLCPTCRAPGGSVGNLADLAKGEPHCSSCNIRFGPEFDRSVEVCFTVATDIRPAEIGAATFCIGGPETSPHNVVQWYLEPGETVEFPVCLPTGPHLFTSPQASEPKSVFLCGEGTGTIRIERCGRRAAFICPDTLPATGIWQLECETAWPVIVRCEVPGWLADAATAAEVTALQTFRDTFSSQVLAPGTEMSVRQVTLLFSDLKGSTALYVTQGDAPSYALVRDHFACFREIIAQHGGGILKTMGDAVMAAFPDPAEAIKAALEVQRTVVHQPEMLPIKIGVHAGPALAVNSEGKLDYFGQVVNRAARMQAHSIGGDVVIAAALAEDPAVTELLTTVRVEPFIADLKGDAPQVPLLRLTPKYDVL